MRTTASLCLVLLLVGCQRRDHTSSVGVFSANGNPGLRGIYTTNDGHVSAIVIVDKSHVVVPREHCGGCVEDYYLDNERQVTIETVPENDWVTVDGADYTLRDGRLLLVRIGNAQASIQQLNVVFDEGDTAEQIVNRLIKQDPAVSVFVAQAVPWKGG